MNAFHKGILACIAAAIVIASWLARYEVVIGSRGDGYPPAYKLDRWTGAVTLLAGANERPVSPPDP